MREVRYLDAYTAGEKPKIDVQFFETEEDLTGFDLGVRVERDGAEVTGPSIDWLDATKAQARIVMGELDVYDGTEPVSRYRLEAWAGDGTDRVATLLIVFDVYQHVGESVPSV